MALIESIPIEIGKTMPSFTLNDSFNTTYTLDQSIGEKGVLIAFTCNHCPYAIAVWPRLIALSLYAKKQGISTLAINPNINPNFPSDSPENMKKVIVELGIPFPYLVDNMQTVATSYNAQCTPDIYLLKKDKTLFYHGRIDDNWKDERSVTQHELKKAIDTLIEGKLPPEPQFPSMGCSIKWC